MGSVQKFKDGGIRHFVDTTAILVATTPIYCLFEKTFGGLTDDQSIASRLMSLVTSYAGIGFLYAKGREISRRQYNITDDVTESEKRIHDRNYSMAFAAAYTPIFYGAVNGLRLLKYNAFEFFGTHPVEPEMISGGRIVMNVGISVLLAIPAGIMAGYSIDLFEGLVGLREFKRKPHSLENIVNRSSRRTGLFLASLLMAATVGWVFGVYKFTPDNFYALLDNDEASLESSEVDP